MGDYKFVASPDDWCESCKISVRNATAKSKISMTPSTKPFELVFVDIIPIVFKVSLTTSTLYKYLFFAVDHYTKYIYVLGMYDSSSETVIECFQQYISHLPNNHRLQNFRVDAGNQLISQEFNSWCIKKNINLSAAAPKHQEQNSIAERAWRTTSEMTRKLLVHANLSSHFYFHAIKYSIQIINVLPAKGLLNERKVPKTPYYLVHNKKPRIGHFHVFRCPCVFKRYEPCVNRQPITRRQLIQYGSRGTFVGFPSNQAGYLIYV